MIRQYCDVCEREIPAGIPFRLRLELERVMVEIMVAVDKTWNAGHVCVECLLRVINEGKKPASSLPENPISPRTNLLPVQVIHDE